MSGVTCYIFLRLGDPKIFWKSPTALLREFLAPLTTLLSTSGGNMGCCPGKFVIVSFDWNFWVTLLTANGCFQESTIFIAIQKNFTLFFISLWTLKSRIMTSIDHFGGNNCGTVCFCKNKNFFRYVSHWGWIILYQFHWEAKINSKDSFLLHFSYPVISRGANNYGRRCRSICIRGRDIY